MMMGKTRNRLRGPLTTVAVLATAAVLPLLTAGCGGGGEDYDSSGYMTGDTDEALFTRGCQEYLRGSLTGSRETFNSLIYRFPESPLRGDAQLAVRKIESELSGEVVEPVDIPVGGTRPVFPSVAIVGTPSVLSTVTQLESLILSTGSRPMVIEDAGAPDVTLVLYPEGYLEQANQVSDSLSGWLSSHSSVPVQPGGDIISTVAPQHSGVVIVIGTDASVDPFAVEEHSVEP